MQKFASATSRRRTTPRHLLRPCSTLWVAGNAGKGLRRPSGRNTGPRRLIELIRGQFSQHYCFCQSMTERAILLLFMPHPAGYRGQRGLSLGLQVGGNAVQMYLATTAEMTESWAGAYVHHQHPLQLESFLGQADIVCSPAHRKGRSYACAGGIRPLAPGTGLV